MEPDQEVLDLIVAPDGGIAPDNKGDTVPYDRFMQVVSKNGKLAHKLTASLAEAHDLAERGATVDTLGRELEAAKTRLATMGADVDLNMGLAERGFDGDGRSIIKMLHANLDEEGRPSALEWVDAMKDDASLRPRPLLGYFDAPIVEDATTEPPKKPKKPKMPRSSRHSGGEGGSDNQEVTVDQLREAREHGMETGDWSKSKDLIKLMG